jgi:hypothetical protein
MLLVISVSRPLADIGYRTVHMLRYDAMHAGAYGRRYRLFDRA